MSSTEPPAPIPYVVSAYCVSDTDLEAFLKKIFPDSDFDFKIRFYDRENWLFQIPRYLTETEDKELDKLVNPKKWERENAEQTEEKENEVARPAQGAKM